MEIRRSVLYLVFLSDVSEVFMGFGDFQAHLGGPASVDHTPAPLQQPSW